MHAPPAPLVWYPGNEILLPDIVRAENCHLYDAQGRRYVDLESGVWCTSIGHGHPRVVRVLAEQPARIAHTGFNYSSGIVDKAAREVLSLLGFEGGRCVFLCSGSEAVEYGVRVVQMLAERPLLLTMADSYFGAYGSASQKREGEWHCFDWTACATCARQGECDASCERWAAIPHERLAGFLFEPGSSSGMVRFPPTRLIESMVRTVRERDGFVLVNEVTVGVGRTGTWFGHQHYGFTPDVVALGKGIGSGYPVSVVAFGPRVVERLGDLPVRYAQSHQNDPLGAAVVSEVLAVIRDEGLIERGRALGERLLAGLQGIQARTGRIREIRSRGLMFALELVDDAATTRTIGTHLALVRRGYLIGRRAGTSVLRLDPSLTVEWQDLAGFLAAFEEVLTEGGA